MKRSIIALIMALAMILTLVACGNSNGDNNNGGNDVKAIQLAEPGPHQQHRSPLSGPR